MSGMKKVRRSSFIYILYLLWVYLFMASATIAFAGNPNAAKYSKDNNNLIWFPIISDTHIRSLIYFDETNYNNFINEALTILNPPFVVNLGDLTDELQDPLTLGQSQWQRYREISTPQFNSTNLFDLPGNHDQYWESETPWPESSDAYDWLGCRVLRLTRYPLGWPRFNQRPLAFYLGNSIQGESFNQTQRSWILRTSFGSKYHFISISTPHPEYTHPCMDGYSGTPAELNNDELNFINTELENNKDANLTFIFGHHPDNMLVTGRSQFQFLLKDYNVSFYGYGHTHRMGESITSGTLHLNVDSLAQNNNYAIVSVDNDGVAITHATGNQWPIVLITTPIDKNLGGINPYAYKVSSLSIYGTIEYHQCPIRALVFDENPVSKVEYRIDTGEWYPMSQVRQIGGSNSYLWETTEWDCASLLPGNHKLEVRATGSTTRSDIITFESEPRLDLIFVIDVTGSMWDDIDSVKAQASAIVDEISTKVSDWRIAVVDFQDFPVYPYGCEPNDMWPGYPGDWPYRAVLPFSTDNTAIINAINGLTPLCGMDWPESYYSALIRSINTEGLGSWRDGAKKVIVLMGDAPPHDPEPFTGYTLTDVVAAAQAVDPAVIYPIAIGWDSTAYAYYSTLAEETGGDVFSAPRASDVVEAIMSAIETALQSPITEAGGPYAGNVGSPITFDASGSYDPDGTIVLYEWDWDNDGTYDESTSLPIISHTWSTEFIGTVRLRVTDNDGLTGIDIASIEITAVLNQPPIANGGPDQILECTSPTGASASLDGSASSDPDGDPLTYNWTGCFGAASGVSPIVDVPIGVCSVDLIVNDGQVNSDPDVITITVQDTTPPSLQCPSNIVDECTSSAGQPVNLGTPVVSDVCSNNIAISNNAPPLFTLGTTPVTWTATDEFGNSSQGIQSVTIVDTTPPDISVSCSPNILWPPNHEMVEISPTITTGDVCDSSVSTSLYQITMNEGEETNTYDPNYDATTGDGHTINDIQVTTDGHIYLRAERSGNNPVGRKYTIIYKSTDDSGNSSIASCEVIVPHDMR